MTKPRHIETRNQYQIFTCVTTRWKDNDVYPIIRKPVRSKSAISKSLLKGST